METQTKRLLDCLGNDDNLRWKAKNQLDRMMSRETTETDVDVEFCFRDSSGRAVYIVVLHCPDEEERSAADLLVQGKSGRWEMLGCKYRFYPQFVEEYISSIYGHVNKATGLQIAQELAFFYCTPKETIGLGPSALSFHPGGVEITNVKSNVQTDSMAFVPYERFGRDDVLEVYDMVLRKYVTGNGFDADKVPKSFLETAFELAKASKNNKQTS